MEGETLGTTLAGVMASEAPEAAPAAEAPAAAPEAAPAAEAPAAAPEAAPAGPVDRKGRPFDPALHRSAGKGKKLKPVLDAKGRLCLKKDRKPKAAAAGSVLGGEPPAAPAPEAAPAAEAPAAEKVAKGVNFYAKTVVYLATGARCLLGGKDATPTDEEQEDLAEAAAAYAEVAGIEMSPGATLVAACGMFMLPALFTDEGQRKLSMLRFKVLGGEPPAEAASQAAPAAAAPKPEAAVPFRRTLDDILSTSPAGEMDA